MKIFPHFNLLKKPFLKSTDFWIIVLFNLLTFCLISIWFRSHTILATAEEGIPLYNSLQTLYRVKNIWQDIGLGYASPFVFPLITLFGFTSLLEILHLSPWLSQAILFYIYIIVALGSVYFLCKALLVKNFTWSIGMLTSCFYLFNLYTYSQVWGRFIYSLFALWAFLPLFILLWIKWLQTYKLRCLFYIALSSLFFSCAFALPSSVLTVWVPVVTYITFSFFRDKEKKKQIILFFLGFIIWVVANIWWLFPLLVFRNVSSLAGLGGSSNIESLQEVSKFFPVHQIILLKQIFLFGPSNFWGVFYHQGKSYLISVLIFTFMVVGILISRKYKSWGFLVALIFISFFVVKGTNPPFGEQIYTFLFTHIPITQVLRNPYEKFGLAFLLPYSIFFGVGAGVILSMFKRLMLPVLCFFSVIFFVYLVQPMWNGDIFPGYVHVTVPLYYKIATAYIDKNTKGKIFSLPFNIDSSVQFSWGYRGEEPSPYLLNRPTISNFIGTTPVDKFYPLLQKYLYNKNFINILSVMSVDSIVFHKDINLSPAYPYDFYTTEKFIQEWDGIDQSKTFGDIKVYTLAKEHRIGEVYAIDNLQRVNSLKELFDVIVSDNFNPQRDGIILKSSLNVVNFPKVLVAPKISYSKISPSKYIVRVINAKTPYILILAESYHPIWQATSNGFLFKKHFLINGYANAWLVDKKGSYTVDLVFPVLPWD